MSAMCRKCLKTASDESRRCASCGGRVVRFSETGEVIEVEAAGDEPTKSGGVPALFANLETVYEVAVPATNGGGSPMGMGQPQAPSAYGPATVTGTSFGGAAAGSVAPANGYCQPPAANGQPQVPSQVNGHAGLVNAGVYTEPVNGQYQPVSGANSNPGLVPPLPMGYTEPNHRAPAPAEPAGTFLLPVTQLDDVVSQMLEPFGFERPAPVFEPPPLPPPPPPPQPRVEPQPVVAQPQAVAPVVAQPVAAQPQAVAPPRSSRSRFQPNRRPSRKPSRQSSPRPSPSELQHLRSSHLSWHRSHLHNPSNTRPPSRYSSRQPHWQACRPHLTPRRWQRLHPSSR